MKTAIVTGASSGIGEAVARALFRANYNVVMAARRIDKLDSLREAFRKEHPEARGKIVTVQCDVTVAGDVAKVVQAAKELGGGVDILVNNAGVMLLSYRCNANAEHLENDMRMVDVNIKGPLYFIDAVLPLMREKKSGHIINVSSDADRKVFPGSAVYSGTKAFLTLYSQGLHKELVEEKLFDIRVSTISLGATETELGGHVHDKAVTDGWAKEPSMKFMTPGEVAEVIMWTLNSPSNINVQNVLFRPVQQAE